MNDFLSYLNQLEKAKSWGEWETQPRRSLSRLVRSRIEEIRAGAVMPDENAPGLWVLEIGTASGARRFRQAREERQGDCQSEPSSGAIESAFYQHLVMHLTAVSWSSHGIPATGIRIDGSVMQPVVSGAKDPAESQEPGPAAILACLKDPHRSREEHRKAIIEAEIVDFEPGEKRELAALLRNFIERHRDSNVPADLVAVGSAIRRFIASAPTEEAFEFAGTLLTAIGRFPPPIEIELELSKMVVRKLTANPPIGSGEYPELAGALLDLALTYLNPRLLARKKHGAVALDAALGVTLTRDPRAKLVAERLQTLGVPWFQTLVAREAYRLGAEIIRRFGDGRHEELLRALGDLAAAGSVRLSK
jgi:hypothetical protein